MSPQTTSRSVSFVMDLDHRNTIHARPGILSALAGHDDQEGLTSQPEYTLPKPSTCPNDRDHFSRPPQPSLQCPRSAARSRTFPSSTCMRPYHELADSYQYYTSRTLRRAEAPVLLQRKAHDDLLTATTAIDSARMSPHHNHTSPQVVATEDP